MFIAHVIPEFKSSSGFMRRRACWMYGEFGDFTFKDQIHLKVAIDAVYNCLFDPDLPVRMMAATSIHKHISNPVVF